MLCYNEKVEKDKPMRKAKKVQVVVFMNDKDRNYVLLLQTNQRRGKFWQNITGGVDNGESFVDAAKRELKEETGIESDVFETSLTFNFHDQWGKDVSEKVFWTNSPTNSVSISSDEHLDYKWIEVDDVLKDSYKYPTNYEAFKECLKCRSK